MEKSIIHINVADFAVAVERVVDRRLRSRPVIIAPEGAVRTTVYDMSEEAYQAGVRKDMPLRRALRRCPDAAILPPHPDRYEQAMTRLLRCALPFSPLIEVTDHKGHLFIDATGTSRLFGPARDVAWRIRRAVSTDLGIKPVWSVAPNKLVAKVATRTVKPTGEYIVRPGDETAFLGPLPVFLLPGIEPEDIGRLRELNLLLAGQVSQLDLAQLDVLFGKRNQCIYRAVRGIDPSPVMPVGQKPPAVRKSHAFGNDTNRTTRINAVLYTLVEQAGAELRVQNLAAGRIRIALDYSDGIRLFRQQRVKPATANDRRLFAVALKVLDLAWVRRVRVRHLRLVCDRLTFPPAQQPLFAEDQTRDRIDEGVIKALDAIRGRFGKEAIQVGRTMVA
jgi:DNA polymerase IV